VHGLAPPETILYENHATRVQGLSGATSRGGVTPGQQSGLPSRDGAADMLALMTDDDLLRYARHLMLDEIGVDGQQ
uniref:hypothetical protein n=1 Tax=Enterobacter hormaechei TaxID=158836 RepID=UPI001952B976